MARASKWIPLVALLLCAGLLGTLEYLRWRVTNPLRFHMERPLADDTAKKYVHTELRVQNTSNYPVVYYGGSMHLMSDPDMRPVCHFCRLKGSTGNGVVIQAGGTYTHQQELAGRVLGKVRASEMEMQYSWAPERRAWFAGTLLPAVRSRLPDKWAPVIPQLRARRERAPLQVSPEGKHEAS